MDRPKTFIKGKTVEIPACEVCNNLMCMEKVDNEIEFYCFKCKYENGNKIARAAEGQCLVQ